MPCFDPGAEAEHTAQMHSEKQKLEAVMCAVFTVLEIRSELGLIFDCINWREAGVTRSFADTWWKRHQQEDKARREQEAARSRLEVARLSALEKLTPAEKIALGLA